MSQVSEGVKFSDEAFYDIIDCMTEHRYCPDGKQVQGCPADETGMPMSCDRCWEDWFLEYGERF